MTHKYQCVVAIPVMLLLLMLAVLVDVAADVSGVVYNVLFKIQNISNSKYLKFQHQNSKYLQKAQLLTIQLHTVRFSSAVDSVSSVQPAIICCLSLDPKPGLEVQTASEQN